MEERKRITPKHGNGVLNRAGKPKGSKNRATIYKEKILAVIEDELTEDIPKFYRQLADTAMKEDAPPWAVKLYGELLLKPVMKSAAEDKPESNGGIRIIVQGSSPKIQSDEPIEAEYEEIPNEEQEI